MSSAWPRGQKTPRHDNALPKKRTYFLTFRRPRQPGFSGRRNRLAVGIGGADFSRPYPLPPLADRLYGGAAAVWGRAALPGDDSVKYCL